MAKNVAKMDNKPTEWTATFRNIYKGLEEAGRIRSQDSFAIEIGINNTVLSRILNGRRPMPKRHHARIEKHLEEKYKVIWALYQVNGDLGLAPGIANDNGIFRDKKLQDMENPELISLCSNYEREIIVLKRKLAAKDEEDKALRQRIDHLQNELLKAKDELIQALKNKK